MYGTCINVSVTFPSTFTVYKLGQLKHGYCVFESFLEY